MTPKEVEELLNIKVDLVPKTSSNRPGLKINPTFITIHNTDNTNPGADALAHARYIKGADARKRKVSWHFTVDDKRCVRHLPLDEMGLHAGTRANRSAIAIEVCMNSDGDDAAATERATLLTALMMHRLNIPASNVVPHKHWTGKNCPRVILRKPGMKRFVERASEHFANIKD